jgi:hypothetical protein
MKVALTDGDLAANQITSAGRILASNQRRRAPLSGSPDAAEGLPGRRDGAPKDRWPRNWRQRLWGGWTCPNCGCEVDRKGKKVSG